MNYSDRIDRMDQMNLNFEELKQIKILYLLINQRHYNLNGFIPHKRYDIKTEDSYDYLFYRACKLLHLRTKEEINILINKTQNEIHKFSVNLDLERRRATNKSSYPKIKKTIIKDFNEQFRKIKCDIITRTLKYGQKSFWITEKVLETTKRNHYIFNPENNHWELQGQIKTFERHRDVYIDVYNQKVFLINFNHNDLYQFIHNRKITITSDKYGLIKIKRNNTLFFVDVLYCNTTFKSWTGGHCDRLYYGKKYLEINSKHLGPVNLLKATKHKPFIWNYKWIKFNYVDILN